MARESNTQLEDPLLDQTQIAALLGISRTQFWRIRGTDNFPQPLKLSRGIRRWRRSQLLLWLRSKDAK